VFVRTDAAYLTYTRKLRVVYRKIFTSAASAADYADGSTKTVSDDPKMAGTLYIALPAAIRYAGNGKWWGYKVIFTDPTTAWSLT
jgi:hypothetical protein